MVQDKNAGTVIVGDLHGRINIITNQVLDQFPGWQIVFIGDYLDSFDESIDHQVNTLYTVLKLCRENDNIIGLLGNHELSYIMRGMRASGWNWKTASHVEPLAAEMFDTLATHWWLTDKILLTHAGANGKLYKSREELEEALDTNDKSLYNIGRFRGGRDEWGGIFWNDFIGEHHPIPGITQIVGHTAWRKPPYPEGIININGDILVDCLNQIPEVLLYKDGKFFIHNLDTQQKELL